MSVSTTSNAGVPPTPARRAAHTLVTASPAGLYCTATRSRVNPATDTGERRTGLSAASMAADTDRPSRVIPEHQQELYRTDPGER